MLSKKHRKFGQLAVAVFAAGVLQSSPAMAQTSNECSAYSIRICNTTPWDALGYTSLKDCRLTEFANCMAGVPPYEPTSFKKEAAPDFAPAPKAAADAGELI